MEWVVGFVIISVTCWWLANRNKAVANRTELPAAQMLPQYEDYRDELERKPVDELDDEEQIIRRAHDAVQSARQDRTTEYRAKQLALMDDQKKLKRATDFIETSCLNLALPYVQERTQYWPSWSKMDESRWTAPFPISDVDGTTSSGSDKNVVQLRADMSALYRIEFERSRAPSDDDWVYGSMTLFVDGEEKLGMFVRRNWTKEFDSWHFALVESLKVGPWIEGFIGLYTRLRSVEENDREDQSHEWVRAQAAKINLGDTA